jgi:general secretion pathway protein I
MSGRSDAGFTLLEVVVALVIAALALIVLFRAGGDGLSAADSASRAEQAVERAQSHLAAVGNGVALAPGEDAGDDGAGYRWHLRITPRARWQLPGTNGATGATMTLFDVEVAVTWPGRDHARAIVLRTERIGTAVSE